MWDKIPVDVAVKWIEVGQKKAVKKIKNKIPEKGKPHQKNLKFSSGKFLMDWEFQ